MSVISFMNRLPSDILYDIFIELPFKQKQECMLVCRQWDHLISTTCLFHTIFIDRSKPSQRFYSKFMDKIEETPSLGNQVMNLSVTRMQRTEYRKRLLLLLPNLRRIEMKNAFSQSCDFGMEDLEVALLKNRIEYILDLGGCELTRTMAKLNRCSHLNELNLNLADLVSANINIIPELKNMPVLKRLVLRNLILNADDLSIVHTNIPSLETLNLKSAFFESGSDADITPVTSLTTLIFAGDSTNKHFDFPYFASKKYPKLKHFSYQLHDGSYMEGDFILFVSQKYPQLDYDAYQLCDVLNDNDDIVALNNLYNVQFPLMLNNLGACLESLDLRGTELVGYEILQKMDESGCHIKKLTLYSDSDNTVLSILSRSEQARSLEELTILDIRPCSFEWLENIKKLNSLELSYMYDRYLDTFGVDSLCLRSLLESCPSTFKSLKLKCCSFDFKTTPKAHFSIEKLELNCSVKPSDLDVFISNCLPNLDSLYIKNGVQKKRPFYLPNQHLSVVQIWIAGHILSLSTSEFDKTRQYNALDNKKHIATAPINRYIAPMDYSDFKGEPDATVIIHSVKKIYLNGYPLLLT